MTHHDIEQALASLQQKLNSIPNKSGTGMSYGLASNTNLTRQWYLQKPYIYYLLTPIIIGSFLFYTKPKAVRSNVMNVNRTALEQQRSLLGMAQINIDYQKLFKTTMILSIVVWLGIYYYLNNENVY